MNKVIIIGRMGQDPEILVSKSGTSYGTISIATNERRKNGDEWEDHTEWHRIVVLGRLAEIVGDYVKKGDMIAVEGSLQTRTYEKDGEDRYVTEVRAVNVELLGGKREEAPAERPKGRSNSGRGRAQQRRSAQQATDDDIPF